MKQMETYEQGVDEETGIAHLRALADERYEIESCLSLIQSSLIPRVRFPRCFGWMAWELTTALLLDPIEKLIYIR